MGGAPPPRLAGGNITHFLPQCNPICTFSPTSPSDPHRGPQAGKRPPDGPFGPRATGGALPRRKRSCTRRNATDVAAAHAIVALQGLPGDDKRHCGCAIRASPSRAPHPARAALPARAACARSRGRCARSRECSLARRPGRRRRRLRLHGLDRHDGRPGGRGPGLGPAVRRRDGAPGRVAEERRARAPGTRSPARRIPTCACWRCCRRRASPALQYAARRRSVARPSRARSSSPR